MALAGVAALLLSACGTDDGGETAQAEGPGCAAPEGAGQIRIGFIPWDEAIAVTNLWSHVLSECGYDVEKTQLEVGGIYAGLANGQIELFLDSWLPSTHSDYMEEFGSELEDLGIWFDEAPLTWTVPAYLEDINSIEDLEGNADMFDGQIVGIEPGAGLTRISKEEVIPAYGLGDEYELVESSTPAMLAELENAISSEEPIVVTLWRPHFAYGQWDLKDLEDPKNALGDPEEIHMLGRPGFTEDFPQVADWLSRFSMTNDELAELEVMINEQGEEAAVEQWAADNADLIAEWVDGWSG